MTSVSDHRHIWHQRQQGDFPLVMGILNVTPDSFSDGGRYHQRDHAVDRAMAMIDQGADVIDVGGESTRPGAVPVSVDEELQRVVPVIRALRQRSDIPISIDTFKLPVMQAAMDAGATLINDVTALSAKGAEQWVCETKTPVCLMHMQGEPGTMQYNPVYEHAALEVQQYLLQRAQCLVAGGMVPQDIWLDPGIGFGKRQSHNQALIRALPDLVDQGFPVLLGASRKRLIADCMGDPLLPTDQRLGGSIAIHLVAIQAGVKMVRVHDVQAMVQAIRVWQCVT